MRLRAFWFALLFAVCGVPVGAQDIEAPATIFDHPDDQPYFIGGQANIIFQAHGDFPARYSGPQSFRADAEHATSRLLTLQTGLRVARRWALRFDLESAGGAGLSQALGLAGFTNLDVVRNPTLGATPYLARLMIQGVIPLSSEETDADRSLLAPRGKLPARRLEIKVGKMGLIDYFDVNAVGSDSHLQFTNWTVDNNGAYDYAADTRGYTYGALVEFDARDVSVRGAVALMPTVANGIDLDSDIARARGENLEVEWRAPRGFTLRVLGYTNHANMGLYSEAINAYLSGHDPTPSIEAHRAQGRVKHGAGVNVEQELPRHVRLFARAGGNQGDTESFAYTEVNNTFAAGADTRGGAWSRPGDRAGVAFVSNGLSDTHREYLSLGGLGFLLGDGRLTYGREQILETYYTLSIWRGVYASGGLQYIVHPGYNRDRGPVLVPMARAHLDF
jgi:carbohydrate-selective porin OprB